MMDFLDEEGATERAPPVPDKPLRSSRTLIPSEGAPSEVPLPEPRPQALPVDTAIRPRRPRSEKAEAPTVLTPPREVGIEWALEWMAENELLEVTPRALRLRKRVLPANLRKR